MHYPQWLTWYKKPEYRDIKEYSNAIVTGRRTLSPDGRGKTSIPARLRLERVLENKTCSPMSLYDFYMYLKYIEFSPENLEFYIWFKSYQENWKRDGDTEKDNASIQSCSESTSSLNKNVPKTSASELYSTDPEIAETLSRITDMLGTASPCNNGSCVPRALEFPKPPPTPSKTDGTLNPLDNAAAHGRRAELNAVVHTFLTPGAEKELNIPAALRDNALNGLQNSADPIHLQPIADHVYLLLRNCSHRNFVRLGVSNGTFETVCAATGLGIVLTIAGVLLVVLRGCVPHVGAHSRHNVWAAWPLWWIGTSLVLSGLRGSCFFLLLFTRRQPLPWERFDDSNSTAPSSQSSRSPIASVLSRLMIFDRKLRVKDSHLRRLQHRIVIQSLFFGAVFSCVGVLIFIFLPMWKETRH